MCPHTLRSQCLARPNDGNTARHARNVARATRLREPALSALSSESVADFLSLKPPYSPTPPGGEPRFPLVAGGAVPPGGAVQVGWGLIAELPRPRSCTVVGHCANLGKT